MLWLSIAVFTIVLIWSVKILFTGNGNSALGLGLITCLLIVAAAFGPRVIIGLMITAAEILMGGGGGGGGGGGVD